MTDKPKDADLDFNALFTVLLQQLAELRAGVEMLTEAALEGATVEARTAFYERREALMLLHLRDIALALNPDEYGERVR